MSEKIFDAMEFIWERLPKEKDGQIRYLKGDLPYLYQNGFVDTAKFTLEQWINAFAPFLQQDGTYLLSKRQFLMLRIFRYIAPDYNPFEPQKLRQGAWPEKELAHLFSQSIKPSSTIPEEVYWNSIKALKKAGHVNEKDELVVSDAVIKQLEYLIDKFPSPRRRLEKEVTRIRQEKDKQSEQHQQNRDATSFSFGESEKDHKISEFQKLQTTSKKEATPASQPQDKQIDLKSLRKGTTKTGGKIIG